MDVSEKHWNERYSDSISGISMHHPVINELMGTSAIVESFLLRWRLNNFSVEISSTSEKPQFFCWLVLGTNGWNITSFAG